MANKRNYQKELDGVIKSLSGKVPTLLLHSCCAPCSSYVLEYLSQYFQITVFYYNPNIYPPEEYDKRVLEQKELIRKMEVLHPALTTPNAFTRWRAGWRICRKDRRDALGVMNSVCGRLRKRQCRGKRIILRRPFPSAR